MYGLLERDFKFILKAINGYPEIEEVIIFESRAMENYKKGLGIDLALKGEKFKHHSYRQCGKNNLGKVSLFERILNCNKLIGN
ncbi:hypothetical protein EDD65_103110 [Keratinibaculum paraultunense]|uniref:Uncharacterized protein n=1 Tax=Keratinibaculum paraultunense TaxID=1278232 RepID=A0A4R3KXW7_9FIRM|nr:nucleotidyltransferase domain-containing protein [Keratinibaculum paraultunense]QQY80281.1 hypothetical protein JL105_02805 [Keratinibaculum paraultunense]TCS90800.1 hypothetical protein EDD65_103110 [Keratinibaculum paraultunense]